MTVQTFCILTEDDTCVGRILADDENLDYIENFTEYLDYKNVRLVVEEYPSQYEYNPPGYVPEPDPFASLTLDQKKQIAAILGIGSSEPVEVVNVEVQSPPSDTENTTPLDNPS
mgnify:FL=1